MPVLLDLYLTFFMIGGTSFGGGYAMLPTLKKVIAEKKAWATEEELGDYFAIGQCTPGIIAVNVATFIGMKFQGVAGAVVATLGLVSPCIVIISLLESLIGMASESIYFESVFHGLKVCVAVLIGTAAWGLVKKAVVDRVTGRIFYLTFVAMAVGSLCPDLPEFMDVLTSPVTLVVLAGLTGMVFSPEGMNSSKSSGDGGES